MEEYSAKITLDDQLRRELDNNKKQEESETPKDSKSKIDDEVGELPSNLKSNSVSNLKSEVISEEYSEFQSISKQSRQNVQDTEEKEKPGAIGLALRNNSHDTGFQSLGFGDQPEIG